MSAKLATMGWRISTKRHKRRWLASLRCTQAVCWILAELSRLSSTSQSQVSYPECSLVTSSPDLLRMYVLTFSSIALAVFAYS